METEPTKISCFSTSTIGEKTGNVCGEMVAQQKPARGFIEIDSNNPATESLKDNENVPLEKLVGSHVLNNILETCPPVDTILSCSNGKLGAHRAVLVTASSFLGFILSRHVAGELATIVLPDISLETTTTILTLCYTGQMIISTDNQDEVYSAMETLMIGTEAEFTLSRIKMETQFPEKIECQEQVPDVPTVVNVEAAIPGPDSAELHGTSSKVSKRGPNPKGRRSKSKAKPRSRVCVKSNLPRATSAKLATNNFIKKEDGDGSELEFVCGDRSDEDPKMSIVVTEFKTIFSGIMLLDGNRHVCMTCDGILPSEQMFKKHLCNGHGISFTSTTASLTERKQLLRCDICSVPYVTMEKVSQCLNTHGFSKCFTCFGLIPANEFVQHCRKVHGVRTTFALVSKCRWCDLAIAIGKDATNPQSHAISTHITKKTSIRSPNEEKPSTSKFNRSKVSTEEPISKDSRKESKSNMQRSGTLFPFLKRGSHDQTHAGGPPTKRRKLDEQGKPLQLSKRTGSTSWKSTKRKLLETGSFTKEPPSFNTNPETMKLVGLCISKLPTVCIQLLLNDFNMIDNLEVVNDFEVINDSEISRPTCDEKANWSSKILLTSVVGGKTCEPFPDKAVASANGGDVTSIDNDDDKIYDLSVHSKL